MQRNQEPWKKIWRNANENKQLREEYKWIDGAGKTQHENFTKYIQVSIAKLTKQKKGYQNEDQLNEKKWEGKIREKK